MDNVESLRKRIEQLEEENRKLIHHASKLTKWTGCMSYNDSYFGEPAGLVKSVSSILGRIISGSNHESKS